MQKVKTTALVFAVVALAISCAPSISRTGYGKVTVAFGTPSARSSYTGWPGDNIPAFSSVTVKVSAGDISPVTVSASGSAGSISIQAPAGSARLVELIAIPAVGGTAPAFAKSYYGSATVDLAQGQTTAVTIKLALSETKIAVPKAGDRQAQEPDSVLIADSLTSGISATIPDSAEALAFDSYGRLFVSSNDYGATRLYTNLKDSAETVDEGQFGATAMAYDGNSGRLYSLYVSEGSGFWYTDLSSGTSANTAIQLPAEYGLSYYSNGLAVDDAGYLYVGLMSSDYTEGIGKLSIPGGGGVVTASILGFVPLENIGLGYETNLEVRDLRAQGGALYIAAADVEPYGNYIDYLYSRGKVVALDTASLSKRWETGWAGNETHFPSSPNRNKQFYGPLGFVALAPKKLYVADEGFYWDGIAGSDTEGVSRVLEVDLDTHQITGIGLEDIYFVEDYSGLTVYGSYGGGQP